MDIRIVITGLIVAVGIALAGFFVKSGLENFHEPTGLVHVKGLVEVPVKADFAVWQINYENFGNNLQEAVASSKASKEAIDRFLAKHGLTKAAKPMSPSVEQRENPDKTLKVAVKSSILISSDDVDRVDGAYSDSSVLLNDGVSFIDPWNARPRYSYKKFNERRPEIFSQAVKNAREMAEKFAKDSGVALGQIASADQGQFEILSQNATGDLQEYSKDKLLRVVSRFSYRTK